MGSNLASRVSCVDASPVRLLFFFSSSIDGLSGIVERWGRVGVSKGQNEKEELGGWGGHTAQRCGWRHVIREKLSAWQKK